jgi:hypothetical protein
MGKEEFSFSEDITRYIYLSSGDDTVVARVRGGGGLPEDTLPEDAPDSRRLRGSSSMLPGKTLVCFLPASPVSTFGGRTSLANVDTGAVDIGEASPFGNGGRTVGPG